MIVVFDLDDTLYDEITFVKSGFNKVSEFLSDTYKLDKQRVYNDLYNILNQHGRGEVFDKCLTNFNIYSKKNVKKCISVYRTHFPKITLPLESIKVLTQLSMHHVLYVVTDGNKLVQNNKMKALQLKKYVKKTIATHDYGISKAKPSVYCFELIKNWEKTSFTNMIYIGDNPNKDFINIKKAKMNTIRINQGMFKDVLLSKKYSADFKVNSLSEITSTIKKLENEKGK